MAGTGSGPNAFNESETVAKFEIMDGAPAPPAQLGVGLGVGVGVALALGFGLGLGLALGLGLGLGSAALALLRARSLHSIARCNPKPNPNPNPNPNHRDPHTHHGDTHRAVSLHCSYDRQRHAATLYVSDGHAMMAVLPPGRCAAATPRYPRRRATACRLRRSCSAGCSSSSYRHTVSCSRTRRGALSRRRSR